MEKPKNVISLPTSSIDLASIADALAAEAENPLFSADIYEIKERGTAANKWETLVIPAGARGSKDKNNRFFFSHTYPAPRRIPANGEVTLRCKGDPVHSFEYRGRIPSVRSTNEEVNTLPPDLVAAGLTGGMVRLAGPQGPHAIEAEFPGYDSHPAELWVQLNQTTDPFVIQLKLTKMPPEDVFRDLAGGAYYIYGVSRFIIYVAVPNGLAGERGAQAGPAQHTAVPKSDREKVLAI
jgi:hypothetical protein